MENNSIISSSRIVFADEENLDKKINDIKEKFAEIVNEVKEIEAKLNLQ